MAYKRITKDTWEIQVDYGYGDGFEFVAGYDTRKEARLEKMNYVANTPQYPSRVKMVRSKITEKPTVQIKKKEYTYQDWLSEVDCSLMGRAELEHVDVLANTPYREYFDKGSTPEQTADLLIRGETTQ